MTEPWTAIYHAVAREGMSPVTLLTVLQGLPPRAYAEAQQAILRAAANRGAPDPPPAASGQEGRAESDVSAEEL